MELNEYQKRAMGTCTKSSDNFSYMFLNLAGEVGEFASKVAKWIRKEKTVVNNNHIFLNVSDISEEDERELRREAGDILWQLSGLCAVMGWSLEKVAQENLAKLADRQNRHVIVGDGDNR